MFLEQLNTKPSNKKIFGILGIGIATIIVSLPTMNYYFELSNYPVSFFESQLSFSGEIIKSHYSNLTREEITFYLYGNIVDYGFMIGNGLVKFGVAIIVARGFREGTRVRNVGLNMVLVGLLGTVFDALENIFIILMTFNPSTFPNIFAIIHSIFALLKYTITIIFYGWILGAIFYLLLQWLRSSTRHNTVEAK
jgi:hypothetical protein